MRCSALILIQSVIFTCTSKSMMAQQHINLCSGSRDPHNAAAGYSGEIKIFKNETNCLLTLKGFSPSSSIALHHVYEAPCRIDQPTIVINDRPYCAIQQGYISLAVVFSNKQGNIIFNLTKASTYDTSFDYYIGKFTKQQSYFTHWLCFLNLHAVGQTDTKLLA